MSASLINVGSVVKYTLGEFLYISQILTLGTPYKYGLSLCVDAMVEDVWSNNSRANKIATLTFSEDNIIDIYPYDEFSTLFPEYLI